MTRELMAALGTAESVVSTNTSSASLEQDVADLAGFEAVATILDIVCGATGMRFAAVARVTDKRWIACQVKDDIGFGLKSGGELEVESTICDEIRQSGCRVVINDVNLDPVYCMHKTAAQYGFQSYISVPIVLAGGEFWGTLCAIDPEPREVENAKTIGMFENFAELIGCQLSAIKRSRETEALLKAETILSAQREQFIAVFCHDLRNPLTAIDLAMQLLLRETLAESAVDTIQSSRQCIRRVHGLVDDILDFARGRMGGGIPLDRDASEPLEPVLRQVIAEFQYCAPDVVMNVSINIPKDIECDRRRIGQLASNLIGNALVHGSPEVGVQIQATACDGWFEFSVTNGGRPISPRFREAIFEPFFRGENQSHQHGLGLGLFISKEISKAHGGTLSVSSTMEETKFTFRMPCQARE